METITYSEANERYDIEQYVEAPFFEDAEVHVHEEDARIDGDFDISEHGNSLFLQGLHVTGNIINSSDGDGPIFLVVLGSCTARNILIDEPLVCIQQDLTVENGILANYNHGMLRVRGNLSAKIICAEHDVWVSGNIHGATVDLGGLHVRDEGFTPTISRDQLSEASRYFVDDVLRDGRLDAQAIGSQMEAGAPILRSSPSE
jgi:hypothetical protein